MTSYGPDGHHLQAVSHMSFMVSALRYFILDYHPFEKTRLTAPSVSMTFLTVNFLTPLLKARIIQAWLPLIRIISLHLLE